MKRKFFTQTMKALFLLVFILLIWETGWGQTIVNFPLTSDNIPSQYSANNQSCLVETNATGGDIAYDVDNGVKVSGWDSGSGTKSWNTTSFNTTNYLSIKFSIFDFQ